MKRRGLDFVDGRLASVELACSILIKHLATDEIKAELAEKLDELARVELTEPDTETFREGIKNCADYLLQRNQE